MPAPRPARRALVAILGAVLLLAGPLAGSAAAKKDKRALLPPQEAYEQAMQKMLCRFAIPVRQCIDKIKHRLF